MREKTLKAFCFRSGEVRVADEVPARALLITSGPQTVLPGIVEINASPAFKPGVLLVPGVKEAANDDEALDAVDKFRKVLNKSICSLLYVVGGRHGTAS